MTRRTPKWHRQPRERPSQITRAALEVFGEAGVAATTLDQIADRAGVSTGTIYLYFSNKEELFRQTIRDALSSNVRDEPEAGTTATRQLLDTVGFYWDFLNSETAVTVNRLVSAEQLKFPELAELYAAEVVVRLEEQLRVIIQRGIAGGEFFETDPAVTSRMLTALTVQNASWVNGGVVSLAGKSSKKVLRELTEFVIRSLAPEDAAFAQADGAPAGRGGLNN